MPRTTRTLQLNASAHQLGDAYYRHLTAAAQSEVGIDNRCVDLAKEYIGALETLHSHLLTLESNDEVDTLIHTTRGHINLVRRDLERFEKETSASIA